MELLKSKGLVCRIFIRGGEVRKIGKSTKQTEGLFLGVRARDVRVIEEEVWGHLSVRYDCVDKTRRVRHRAYFQDKWPIVIVGNRGVSSFAGVWYVRDAVEEEKRVRKSGMIKIGV